MVTFCERGIEVILNASKLLISFHTLVGSLLNMGIENVENSLPV